MRFLRSTLLAGVLLAGAAPAAAFVPQTIVIDGINDFDPANLLDDDRGDTQIQNWCVDDPEPDSTMDIGRVYITNDANYLYVGYEYFEDCFTSPFVQLGIAIDVNNTVAGGTSDPFTRLIGWSNVPFKPDAYIYLEQTASNYEIFYRWTGTAWADSTRLINPAGAGSNALGASDHARFVELRIPFSALRVAVGQKVNIELWVTQNSPGKGPLDAAASDDVQMSRAASTTFDTTAVVQMTRMHAYTILSAVDNTPPFVENACAVAFPLAPDKRFITSTNKIDVLFSEPVDLATAQTTGNYAYSGPVPRTITSAIRDATNPALVHLTLNVAISANAAFYHITVTGVRDAAANTIVANGVTNVGSFFIQNLVFNGDFRLRLCQGQFATTDTFAIEGSLPPLTFAELADNARMTDANGDSVYTTTVPFCMSRSRVTGKAEADLEWKFSHTPSAEPYEPGANRFHRLSSDSGATVTLAASWGNDEPGDFTDRAMDVIFQVDARRLLRSGPHQFWLTGSQAPLSFVRPGLPMRDDGLAHDLTANDSIYTVKVRFGKCADKNLRWKVVYDSTAADTVYECPGQGDRSAFLNSAAFDTVGGANGALRLPARALDRCTVTDKAVAVVFKVFTRVNIPPIGSGDTLAVMGNRPPLNPDRPPSPESRMFDDGVPPDAAAGDEIFTRRITFPDSTGLEVEFKYWLNTYRNFGFECEGFGNRRFVLDDVNFSTTNPMVRNLDLFDTCEDLVGVPPARPGDAVGGFAVLRQSFPNPFSPRTTIRFDLRRPGRVTLSVYDVSGRRVARLLDASLPAGPHELAWDGRDAGGSRVKAGIYLYELAQGSERVSRRLVVTR